MKKLFLIAFLLFISLLPIPVFGMSISFNPSQEIWVEEDLEIFVNATNCSCLNATMVGENGYTIYIDNFTWKNGLYTTKISKENWMNEPENFDLNVYCLKGNETQQISTRINVSKFNVEILGIQPGTIYLGDIIEVNVLVEKNAEPINSPDVKFKIILDGITQQPEIRPPYHPEKGWIIFLNSSKISNPIGKHELQIIVSYDRINSTKTKSFTIKDPIQFYITDMDKTWVKPNDIINLKIQAFERGNIIPLNTQNLEIKVDTTRANITTISPSGNFFTVTIFAPNLSPNVYSLTASLSYKNYTYTTNRTVYYIVPINGKFVDENEKGIPVKISFFSDSTEKLRIYTDSSGTYSGSLPPGTYDVEVVFPQSTLRLYEVEIKSFEDPIKYYYFGSLDLEGLNVVGLFVYETDLNYYKASIEMKYEEKNVLNENLIKVYKCENWNSGRKECYGKWIEVPGMVDSVRNLVYVNTTSLSAYVIGTLKKLSIDFNLNREVFYLKDLVKIRGIVTDEYKDPVSNASISIKVKGTTISAKTSSDSNGLFTIEFLTPEKEGKYSLIISAEKHPYLSFNSSFELKVEKSKEVSIVFPDTLRIKQGENLTQDFSVINIGQSKLYNLSISLIGIPREFYDLTPKIEELEVGEERKLSIFFNIPENASVGTSSATIKVFNDEVEKEKIFGFTILEKNQTKEVKPAIIGFFGKISLPQISFDFIHIFIFALISFSLAFLLKKRKIEKQARSEIKNFLLELKNYLKNKQVKDSTNQESEKGVG